MTDTELHAARAEKIARLEQDGRLDPDCPSCRATEYPHYRIVWTPEPHGNRPPFAPPHKPSRRCQSGQHPHCTCDVCF